MDEIDLDLYGPEPVDEEEEESEEEEDEDVAMGSDLPLGDVDMEEMESKAKAAMANPEGKSVQATHWCLIYRSDGALEVKLFDSPWDFFFVFAMKVLRSTIPKKN